MTPAGMKTVRASMLEAGVPSDRIQQWFRLAKESRGAMDLLHLWGEHVAERDEIVVELDQMLEDRDPDDGQTLRISSHADADAELARRQRMKVYLRAVIDRNGGVSKVAAAAGMTQPSLSRLLNSMSEPRPATLRRIAAAIGAPASALDFDASEAAAPRSLRQRRQDETRLGAARALASQLHALAAA